MGKVTTYRESDTDSMPSLDDASGIEHAFEGQALVALQVLHVQGQNDKENEQRENIFYNL